MKWTQIKLLEVNDENLMENLMRSSKWSKTNIKLGWLDQGGGCVIQCHIENHILLNEQCFFPMTSMSNILYNYFICFLKQELSKYNWYFFCVCFHSLLLMFLHHNLFFKIISNAKIPYFFFTRTDCLK